MPIIIPTESVDSYPAQAGFNSDSTLLAALTLVHSAAATFSSASTLAGTLGVTLQNSATFQSISTLAGNLGQTNEVAATFESASNLLGDLRLNDEANVFPAASFASASNFTATVTRVFRAVVATFESSSALTADAVVELAPDFGFTIFIDVLDTPVANAQAGKIRRYTARMLVNGTPVPIRRAELEASQDTLGMEARITLAKPLVSQVALAATIDFQIGIWTGASYQHITMISGGKLSSRSQAIQNEENIPADEVTLSVIDIIADRWNRAPRSPVHLFDPNKVDPPSSSQIAEQRIQLRDGTYINPTNIAIPGMRLRDVLIRAYVNGLGFSEVVCNIPNFPVSEANFTLDGGYDGGVRPILSLFSPLLFTDANNRLFIIDPDAPLPSGLVPRDFVQGNIKQINDSIPQREPTNALLVRLQTLDSGGEFFVERLDQDGQETGTFGLPSFTQTDITKRVREYRTFAEPFVVIREEVVDEKSTTLDWNFNVLEEIVTVQHFDALNRKTGYTRTVARRLPDLNNNGVVTLLQNCLKQEQTIVYKVNPFNPHEDIQDRVTTVESGLVLVDNGTTYLGEPYKIPLTDAHVSGYIDPDGDMAMITAGIKTTVEQLRIRGDQVDMEVRVFNHLSETPTRAMVSSRPGSVTLNRQKQIGNRNLLITIPGTDLEGRRAPVFDAGELPPDVAIDLAERQLQRMNNPPKELELNPAFIDLSIRRGVLLRPRERHNVILGIYIVTGFRVIVNEYNPEQGITGEMVITAREIKNA